MSEGQCGNCDHYHYLVQGKIECFVDGKLHETADTCNDYKKRVTSKPLEARQKEAFEIRREREAKAAEQRDREFAEKMAEKDRKHAEELQQIKMKHEAELARKNRQLQIVIAIGTIILAALITKLFSLW
jgi:type IV secretory pathway VirB10-like protein